MQAEFFYVTELVLHWMGLSLNLCSPLNNCVIFCQIKSLRRVKHGED